MVFSFARISAACGLDVTDIFHQQRRLWLRLNEKGGKFHEMPCHHTLEGYLAEYIERGRLAPDGSRFSRPSGTAPTAVGRRSSTVSECIEPTPGPWCAGAPWPPVSPP
jgi:hypothetical protein